MVIWLRNTLGLEECNVNSQSLSPRQLFYTIPDQGFQPEATTSAWIFSAIA
jgi:hypothetical protein